MAVDEALLETAVQQQTATLRLYRWSQPTLSLGYFQALDERARHAGSATCPVVRRTTGGGAIVHDHELTYSFTAPAPSGRRAGVQEYYDLFHETLVATLASAGLQAAMVPSRAANTATDGLPAASRPQTEPFLCFQRRAAGDVIVGTDKVAGSAQRRHQRAVLQHGSLLLRRSKAAYDLPGLEDLLGQPLAIEPLVEEWLQRIARRLGAQLYACPLSAEERRRATDWESRKFIHPTWLGRR